MPEISREAALFEKANIEDIGVQPELFPTRRRSSSHRSQPPSPRALQQQQPIEPEQFPGSGDAENEETIIVDEGDLGMDASEISPSPQPSPMSREDETVDGINNYNIVLEYPELEYEHRDYGYLGDEIGDWFTSSDLRSMAKFKLIVERWKEFDPNFFNLKDKAKRQILQKTASRMACADVGLKMLKEIIYILYLSLGGYGDVSDTQQQMQRISNFAPMLLEDFKLENGQTSCILAVIVGVVLAKSEAILAVSMDSSHPERAVWSDELHYSLTILYVVMCVFLDTEDGSAYVPRETKKLSQVLAGAKFLPRLLAVIDKWRWLVAEPEETQPQQQTPEVDIGIRIRDVLLVLWKTILVMFGGSQRYTAAKDFLKTKLQMQKQSTNWEKISPFDYHLYKNELLTRYPSLKPDTVELPDMLKLVLEDQPAEPGQPDTLSRSSSMSSSEVVQSMLFNPQIENGRRGVANVAPEIHIATPAPSPKLTQCSTGGSMSNSFNEDNVNGKSKRVFFTSPAFPNIYPIELDGELPYSIQQASEIFYSNVKEDLYTKQMVLTLEEFLEETQAKHFTNGDVNKKKSLEFGPEDIEENPLFVDEITSLIYVEEFYSESLKNLDSLVVVLMRILGSNIDKIPQTEKDISDLIAFQQKSVEHLSKKEKQQLEIQKLREVSLKATSSVAVLLQKWLKLSHFLKFEYFNGLLLDNGFFPTLVKFLGSNFQCSQITESLDFGGEIDTSNRMIYCAYDKLKNVPEYSFWQRSLSLSMCRSEVASKDEEDAVDEKEEESGVRFTSGAYPVFGYERRKVCKFNWRFCFVLTNLFNSLYKTISKNKIRQTIEFLETRPSETLRFYLNYYNAELYRPILKIIKLLIPLNGKKWRSNNMDLISYVYLFEKIGLKDGWLSNAIPAGATDRIRKACDQEYALRSLVAYYHSSHYKHEGLISLTTERSNDEFFLVELEKELMDDFDDLKNE